MELKIKRFMVFNPSLDAPRGGWLDFIASYDTVEEAMANHARDCQLVDRETGLMGLPAGYTEWINMMGDKVGDSVEITCNCGRVLIATVDGDDAQMLVWQCPECGIQRDVNV